MTFRSALFGFVALSALVVPASAASLTKTPASMLSGLGDGATTQQGASGAVTVIPSGLTGLNASGVTNGTLPSARLPLPTGTAPGAVLSATAPSHQYQTGIGTTGAPAFAQPGFGDLVGTATAAQTPLVLPLTGGTLTGPVQYSVSSSVTPFTGSYDSGGSLSWHIGSSYTGFAIGPTIAVPAVVGTPSTQTSAPYTTPDTTDAPQAQVVINTTASAASGNHYNYGVYPLIINLDVSPTLSSLSNPNAPNDVALQMYGLIAPKGGGNCSTVTCVSGWMTNPDLKVIGTQGQVKLGIVTEDDYNNSYQGTDAFQVNHWFTYGGDYPVTASYYSTNQFTDNYTATATVSGTTVTVTSGFKFDPGLTYMLTVGSQLMRVASVTACSPAQVGHSLCSSTLTLQKTPTSQGTGVAISWSPAAATYGMLGSDTATTPLNQVADVLFNTMAYYGEVLGGHHYVDFSSINEATDGTGAPYFGTMNSGQQFCFAGFDACRSQYTNGPADVVQDVANGGIVFDEIGVASGVNHVRVTDAITGGGPAITAVGSDTNVTLTIAAQGAGKVSFGSAVQIPSLQITGTTAATSTATGALQTNGGLGVAGAGYFGSLFVSPTANYQVAVSYNNASGDGFGVIQSAHAGVANTPLQINPNGGPVVVGPGGLQFGTYTSGAASNTGYITVTDAGGTTRHLAVVP